MATTVVIGTPLAEALSNVVQPKLVEMGWSADGGEDSALTEYVILMLVNGKTQEQIAEELSNDLLNLGEGDTQALDFSRWLFEQVEILNKNINGLTSIPDAPQPTSFGNDQNANQSEGQQDADMSDSLGQDSIPTGPRAMRNNVQRGKGRLLNQINRNLERGPDAALHRVRGQQGGGRINTHGQNFQKGQRGQHGAGRMGHGHGRQMGPGQMHGPAAGNMQMTPENQMQLMALLEEQARMMSQLMPGFMPPAVNPNFQQQQQQGRSLFDRIERPGQKQSGGDFKSRGAQNGISIKANEDTEMDTSGDQPQATADGVCRFNLRCTRKDCPYAHQSPAAPEGAPIDVNDSCPFGAACKNKKCTGKHPSPAVKASHQADEICRFFPHCANPNCSFKHPSMPLCRNGADCTAAGCKFTHLTTACKFNPCMNRNCPYKHSEGQQASFPDKVWVAGQEKTHVSERKFIQDENEEEELIKPEMATEGAQPEESTHTSPLMTRVNAYKTAAMRRSCLTHVLQSSPKRVTPITIWSQQARFAHTEVKPYNAAVIGGGITGMTAAWRLCQDPKCTNVTLYEKAPTLGGWLQSETVEVDGGRVVFEYGPRTIRASQPAVLPMLDLLLSLDMEDQLLLINENSPAATNRYIYYPDHLVRLPGKSPQDMGGFPAFLQMLYNLFREPLNRSLILPIVNEIRIPRREGDSDESIGEFATRRMGKDIADNLVSAVFHGIYAGDIYKLSSKTLLGGSRMLESKFGSVTKGAFEASKQNKKIVGLDNLLAQWSVTNDRPKNHFKRLARLMKSSNVFTFKDGLADITSRFHEKFMEQQSKITVVTDAQIDAIKRHSSEDIIIQTSSKEDKTVEPQTFNRVIATIPPPTLSKLIDAGSAKDQERPTHSIAYLRDHDYAVNVMVVNLYYNQPNLVRYRGFGYLIPQSIPLEQNPERALGVIFGSETSEGQDTAPGTKLTVMMGGHWWDHRSPSEIPTPDEAISMSQKLLERHLGIKATPAVARARLQRDAIPQCTVNHLERMNTLSEAVRRDFKSRLTLAGNWYSMHSVGLNDCVVQAYLAATYGVGSFPQQFGKAKPESWMAAMEDQVGGITFLPERYAWRGPGTKSPNSVQK
ncbi:putative nuclear polyadenylated RNA-binding protein Nab2 [Talaromyces proteolyticus]|uniref:protoporphyrinogen oxidase n=1 Tax=Talaromyces proteolyticus TaxID=1131652 RepID=A0AAD4PSS3_9EURO|nr:putative nuclear polyadenylated RNA-binding protein Nab2 [Talaromyces proteolyticus]KAH8689548.1 putative nuclear polyadenylated RNA-binding protein Nab2 [Talaromyces proteolyticus]